MKTYQDHGFQYFYDVNAGIRMWTIYPVDAEGNQTDEPARHFQNRQQLIAAFPQLTFTVTNN